MAYGAKTKATDGKVHSYLSSLASEQRRAESFVLIDLMQRLSGEPPVMWGASVIGFGKYDYSYESGHSGTSMRVGFSPRKAAMTVYIVSGHDSKASMLARLGPHTLGKSCLYIKSLAKVDLNMLEEIVDLSLQEMTQKYP